MCKRVANSQARRGAPLTDRRTSAPPERQLSRAPGSGPTRQAGPRRRAPPSDPEGPRDGAGRRIQAERVLASRGLRNGSRRPVVRMILKGHDSRRKVFEEPAGRQGSQAFREQACGPLGAPQCGGRAGPARRRGRRDPGLRRRRLHRRRGEARYRGVRRGEHRAVDGQGVGAGIRLRRDSFGLEEGRAAEEAERTACPVAGGRLLRRTTRSPGLALDAAPQPRYRTSRVSSWRLPGAPRIARS